MNQVVVKKYRQYLWMITIILAVISIFPLTVLADFGPKEKLTIIVENAPKETYYLDLLVDYDGTHSNLTYETRTYDETNNTVTYETKTYDEIKLDLLEDYNEEGWYPALAHGTNVPMRGSLIGEKKDEQMVHEFGYVGVPDTYRIIIITPDNQVRVSSIFQKKAYQETVIFDYETLTLKVQSRVMDYAKQFVATFLPTILIEGVLLLIFGFSLKKNWRIFLLANMGTQIAMTVILGELVPRNGVALTNILFLPLIEIGIIIIETVLYRRFIKDKTIGRRTAYGIVSNLASYITSVIIMFYYTPWF